MEREAPAQYYRPFLRVPGIGARVLARTSGDPMNYVSALKNAVYAAHPEVPVENIETLEALRAGNLRVPGLNAILLSVFATVALIITLAGVAAVIGTSVSQRTREFGVRMALGASRGTVLKMVLGQGLALVTIGLVAGTAGALLLARGIAAYLYQTPTTDPLVYLAVAAVFQIFDGAQVLAIGLLRGVQDTAVPMVWAAVSYWLVGLPTAYVLGFVLGGEEIGVWLGLVISLIVASGLLMARFWRRAARPLRGLHA